MPSRPVVIFAVICLLLAAVVGVAAVMMTRDRVAGQSGAVTTTGQASVGGPFQLVDQQGRPVDESLLQGRWSLVFFGFTYCPDYCPTTLQMLDATRQALGPEGQELQIVFISVDPERDTPGALADYLSSDGFPEGVVGLTGSEAQVAAAARAYRAFYRRVDQGDGYTMDHSLTIYLMGPDGTFREALAHDLGPERAAGVIRRAMARG